MPFSSAPLQPLDQPPPEEGQFNDLLTQLAQRAMTAQQSAQQAGQTYQQAAAQPEPNVYQQHPLAIAAGQALARIAQGLGNEQAPVNVAQTIRESQADLLKRRMTNLASLHDDYETKAVQASKIGDLEAQMKYKSLADKVAQKRQELHDQASEHIATINAESAERRTAATNASAERRAAASNAAMLQGITAKQNAGKMADIQDVIENSTNTSFTGRPYIDLTNFTGDKDAKRAAMSAAAKQGIPAIGKESALIKNIGIAHTNVLDAFDFIKAKLPSGPAERVAKYGNIKLSKLLQTDEDRAAYGAYMTNAINVLKTEAGGEGSGLRMTQYEISQVQRNLPQLTDTFGVAQRKVQIINRLLTNRAEGLLGPDRRKSSGSTTVRMTDGTSQFDIPASEAADAIRSGLRRVQ